MLRWINNYIDENKEKWDEKDLTRTQEKFEETEIEKKIERFEIIKSKKRKFEPENNENNMGEENNKQQTKYDEKMKNWRKNSETVLIEETEPTINNVITTETTQETTTTKITVKLRQPTLQETTKIRNKKLKPPDPDTTPETSNQNTFETKRNGFKG